MTGKRSLEIIQQLAEPAEAAFALQACAGIAQLQGDYEEIVKSAQPWPQTSRSVRASSVEAQTWRSGATFSLFSVITSGTDNQLDVGIEKVGQIKAPFVLRRR